MFAKTDFPESPDLTSRTKKNHVDSDSVRSELNRTCAGVLDRPRPKAGIITDPALQ